jgi:hypothetical protein
MHTISFSLDELPAHAQAFTNIWQNYYQSNERYNLQGGHATCGG